ncbi:MAG TPA: hypothetical protein VGG74_35000 [Kofleriaceae bacterium]|jgi:hypothetical protein
MAFDPAVLFATSRPRAAYASPEAELDAVRSRAKGIARHQASRRDLATRWFADLSRAALDRGLSIAIVPGLPLEQLPDPIDVYVLHDDQAWRIPALRALWATALVDGRWTFAAEAQEGMLLGYSLDQRASWLADSRWRQSAFGTATMYTLLTSAQRKRTTELGKRCFGDAAEMAGMRLFVHGNDARMLPSAAARVPAGTTLARAAIDHDLYIDLFDPAHRKRRQAVWHATLSDEHARELNAAMRSNVQFLVGKSWR